MVVPDRERNTGRQLASSCHGFHISPSDPRILWVEKTTYVLEQVDLAALRAKVEKLEEDVRISRPYVDARVAQCHAAHQE